MKNKEKILSVNFSYEPLKVKVRTINEHDSEAEAHDKKKFPFRLLEAVDVKVVTDKREFDFNIYEGFKWNGADIPRFLWWLGSSRDNDYVKASMVHDYLLQYKQQIFFEVLKETMTKNEYRRLTSLIFREILKQDKMNTIKANVEAWFVDVFQATLNKKSWTILDK